jgi:hypothetical protein
MIPAVPVLLMVAALAGLCAGATNETLSPCVTVSRGAINGVCFERDGHRLIVYGDPLERWKTADLVLFTHSRRDIVWAGRTWWNPGSSPRAGKEAQFSRSRSSGRVLGRAIDYTQQSTRIRRTTVRPDCAGRHGAAAGRTCAGHADTHERRLVSLSRLTA